MKISSPSGKKKKKSKESNFTVLATSDKQFVTLPGPALFYAYMMIISFSFWLRAYNFIPLLPRR